VNLSVRSCAKLILRQCIIGFREFGQSGDKYALEEFGQGTTQINATI